MTTSDIEAILLQKYSLSDLQFALGATILDLKDGLEEFICEYEEEIRTMIQEDLGEEWDS